LILALETSCDDTCAAVVTEDGRIASNVIASQGLLHARYGGVVPEIASRHHLELVDAVTADALERAGTRLEDVGTVAVTRGPGLIGALLVGVSTAKALAAASHKPLAGVDHLHGHVAANFLEPGPLEPPFLCLVASGGHTLLAGVTSHESYEVLGQTLDDAAGEALDKGARLLGLAYPGGPAIQREAEGGNAEAFELPIAMRDDPSLDFSFSGLKTALLYTVRDLGPERTRERLADLAASYQAAVVDQLVVKLRRAARGGSKRRRLPGGGWRAVALGGGVAANALLRERVAELCEHEGLELKLVPLELCTDNAAMIASAARYVEAVPYPRYLDWDARA
jgi:N6-L-threonylcarbamoyladenine synthase